MIDEPNTTKKLKMPRGREALLAAVVKVVAEKGLRGLTFRSLAAEAKVSTTLAIHHFGTRETLIAEALAWAVAEAVNSTLLHGFASSGGEYREALSNSLLNDPDIHVFQIEMILEARRNSELQEHTKDFYWKYLNTMKSDAVALGITGVSDAMFRAVFAGIDGLILQYLGGAISLSEFNESLLLLWDLVVSGEKKTRAAGTCH